MDRKYRVGGVAAGIIVLVLLTIGCGSQGTKRVTANLKRDASKTCEQNHLKVSAKIGDLDADQSALEVIVVNEGIPCIFPTQLRGYFSSSGSRMAISASSGIRAAGNSVPLSHGELVSAIIVIDHESKTCQGDKKLLELALQINSQTPRFVNLSGDDLNGCRALVALNWLKGLPNEGPLIAPRRQVTLRQGS